MPDDLRSRLEEDLGAEYAIERELGGGGMARVFLARESSLARRVVIKVLMPELAADLSGRRFEREIHVAASLQHANIVPLLRAGDAAGQPYYIMPFVEGRSLRDTLQGERLGMARAIGILRDVARALAYAHEHGVVHRDIKPENVLLSGDAAMVSDFGIAKAIASAREGDADRDATIPSITLSGMMVGTPAYAAPEQMLGDHGIDHRADLYSFGVVAYELLAGGPPFSGTSAQQVVARHLSEAPVPLGERRPECPPEITRLVMQCLEKDPVHRPPSMRDVLAVLDAETTPVGRVTRVRQRITRRQWRLAQGGALVAVLAAGAAMTMQLLRPPSLYAVAVIPFLNERPDTAGAYLGDGMAEGLATALGRTDGIRLVSRSLSARYRDRRSLDIAAVAESLSAEYLVQATIREVTGRLLVNVVVTNARELSEIWSETIEGSPDDVLGLQDVINSRVVAGLADRLGVAAGDASASSGGGTTDQDAYDNYLRARYLALRRGAGVRQSIALYERAIAADPGFGRAHAGLALALQLLPYFEAVDARAQHDRTIAAARQALAADSTLGEAHVALAMAYQHAHQWAEAEASYRRAIVLEPDEPDVNIQYARFLWYTGRGQQALEQFANARRADPFSAVAGGWLGMLLFEAGREAEGLRELTRALEIDSTNPPSLVFAANALRRAGRADEARVLLLRLWDGTPTWRPSAARALATMGEPERARQVLATFRQAVPPPPLLHTVSTSLLLALGDTAEALIELERAADAGEILPTFWSLSSNDFDGLRANPRFAGVVRQFGLDEQLFTSPRGGRP